MAGRVKLSSRCQPMPDGAWCTEPGCGWSDPFTVIGVTLDEHDDALALTAESHAARLGHEVRIVRTQVIILRPEVTADA